MSNQCTSLSAGNAAAMSMPSSPSAWALNTCNERCTSARLGHRKSGFQARDHTALGSRHSRHACGLNTRQHCRSCSLPCSQHSVGLRHANGNKQRPGSFPTASYLLPPVALDVHLTGHVCPLCRTCTGRARLVAQVVQRSRLPNHQRLGIGPGAERAVEAGGHIASANQLGRGACMHKGEALMLCTGHVCA